MQCLDFGVQTGPARRHVRVDVQGYSSHARAYTGWKIGMPPHFRHATVLRRTHLADMGVRCHATLVTFSCPKEYPVPKPYPTLASLRGEVSMDQVRALGRQELHHGCILERADQASPCNDTWRPTFWSEGGKVMVEKGWCSTRKWCQEIYVRDRQKS